MGIECARSRNIHTNLAKCEHYYNFVSTWQNIVLLVLMMCICMHVYVVENFPFYLDDPS